MEEVIFDNLNELYKRVTPSLELKVRLLKELLKLIPFSIDVIIIILT